MKPAKRHILEGTFRKSRHSRRRTVQAGGILEQPPEHLTPLQRECWLDVVAAAPQGVLASLDEALVTAYAVCWATHKEATTAQAEHAAKCPKGVSPLVFQTKNGCQPSPFLAIANRCANTMSKLGVELGFSPLARTRLERAPRPTEEDEEVERFDSILASRPKMPAN